MYVQKQKELQKQYDKQEKKLKELKAGGKSTKQAVSMAFSSLKYTWAPKILSFQPGTEGFKIQTKSNRSGCVRGTRLWCFNWYYDQLIILLQLMLL